MHPGPSQCIPDGGPAPTGRAHAALGNKLEPGPGFPRARARRTSRLLPASHHEGLRQTHPKQGAFQRARESGKPGPVLRLGWGPEVAICTPAELGAEAGTGTRPRPVGAHTEGGQSGSSGTPLPEGNRLPAGGRPGKSETQAFPATPPSRAGLSALRGSDSNRARALRRKITPVAAK